MFNWLTMQKIIRSCLNQWLSKAFQAHRIKNQIWIVLSLHAGLELFKYQNKTVLVLHPKEIPSEIKLKKIRHYHKKSRILILQIPVDILINTEQGIVVNKLKSLCEAIKKLDLILDRKFQLYLELSELNQLTGFEEFFRTEHRPAFGLKLITKKQNLPEFIDDIKNSYRALCNKIIAITLEKMHDELNVQQRKKIYLFSSKLNSSQNFVMFGVAFILRALNGHLKPKLAGIYLTGSSSNKIKKLKSTTNRHYLLNHSLSRQAIELITATKFFFPWRSIKTLPWQPVLISLTAASFLYSPYAIFNEYRTEFRNLQQAAAFSTRFQQHAINLNYNLVSELKTIIQNYPFLISTGMFKLLPFSYRIKQQIHKKISNHFSEYIYVSFKSRLEEIIKSSKIPLADRMISTSAYCSFVKPKRQSRLIEALCYFVLKKYPELKPHSCLALTQWFTPYFLLIDQGLVQSSKERLLKSNLAERVYASTYLHELLDEQAYILLKPPKPEITTRLIKLPLKQTILRLFSRIYTPNMNKILRQYSKDNQLIDIDENVENLWNQEYQSEFEAILHNEIRVYWSTLLHRVHFKHFNSVYELAALAQQLRSQHAVFKDLLKTLYNYQPEWLKNDVLSLEDFDYSLLVDWLKQQYQLLNSIHHREQAGPESFKLLKSAITVNASSSFNTVADLAKSSPFPLSQWIYEIYKNVWRLYLDEFMTYLNQKWKNEVVRYYHQSINNRYPLAESNNELELADFQNFFGPEQILDNFFSNYLKDFFKIDHDLLIPITNLGLKLSLSKENLNFLNDILFIKNHYFDPNDGSPKLLFHIKPSELSPNTRLSRLKLGSINIHYQHGPQNKFLVKWPYEYERSVSALKLSEFNHHEDILNWPGDWSLFHLVNSATNFSIQNNGIELWYEFPKQYCRFFISEVNLATILQLTHLKNLKFINSFSLTNN